MKESYALSTILLMLLTGFSPGFAQQDVTIKASNYELAEGLDLNAVSEISAQIVENREKALGAKIGKPPRHLE